MAKAPRINGLTLPQANFVKSIIKQFQTKGKINYSQAVMESYNVKNINSASTIAADNLQNITIQDQIKQAFTANGLTLGTISGNLGYYANVRAEKVGAEASIKANIELLKLLNAYPGQKKTTVSLSMKANLNKMAFNDVKTELEKVDTELKNVMDGEVVDIP